MGGITKYENPGENTDTHTHTQIPVAEIKSTLEETSNHMLSLKVTTI